MFDVTVFLHGWRAGVQWALDSQGSYKRNNRRNEASPVPLSTNSQEVPAQSKCDLLTPPPSRESLEGFDERGRNCTTPLKGTRRL